MAAHGWGKSPSVEDWLVAEAHRFDFYQAVALVEAMADDKAAEARARDPDASPRLLKSVGEGVEPRREAIRFKSTISLAFPETDIDSLEEPARPDRGRYIMRVNFMSLAGAVGPLPTPFAELVVQRAAKQDRGARDFLDIFNHRLISIAYRIRKLYRIGLGARAPLQDAAARQLFSFMGLGTHAFPDSIRGAYRALLHHTGAFTSERRSMAALEAILRHHFGVPIVGVQLTGRFYKLEPQELTAIGPSGKNRTLGRDAIVGGRVWDQTASFEIRVGPLTLSEYLRFLPGGDAIGPLAKIVRFYAGPTFDFTVRLLLKSKSVPATRLGYAPGNMLSYTAWIGTARRNLPPPEIVLPCDLIEDELRAIEAEELGAGGGAGRRGRLGRDSDADQATRAEGAPLGRSAA